MAGCFTCTKAVGFTPETEFRRELGRQSMSQKEIDEESILVLRK